MYRCSNLLHKCEMRKVLVKLTEERKRTGELGSLGPARFEPPAEFFRRYARDQRLVHSIKTLAPVIAIGDIHGDFLALLSILFVTGVIDAQGHWKGRNSIVVLCGDLLDRGGRGDVTVSTTPNYQEEVDILQYLHALNLKAKPGHVIAVLGNHEIRNIYMDQSFEHYQDSPQVEGWGGLQEKYSLFRPGGPVSTYFSNHFPIILQVNHFLFAHGGYQGGSPNELNREVQAALRSGKVLSPRLNFILEDRSGSCDRKALQGWDGLVLGHTVVEEVKGTCQNKVWMVDIAMSEAFGESRKLGALEIQFSPGQTLIKTLMYERNTLKAEYYLNGQHVATKTTKFHRRGQRLVGSSS